MYAKKSTFFVYGLITHFKMVLSVKVVLPSVDMDKYQFVCLNAFYTLIFTLKLKLIKL